MQLIIGTTKRSLQYYINWHTVLPKAENINHKYLVRFMFSSVVYQSPYMDIFSVNIDFGGSNVYNQTNSKSTYLGLIYPINNVASAVSGTYTAFYYTRAKEEDNIPITVEYPNNNIITVTTTNIYTSSGSVYNTDYYLTLEFMQI